MISNQTYGALHKISARPNAKCDILSDSTCDRAAADGGDPRFSRGRESGDRRDPGSLVGGQTWGAAILRHIVGSAGHTDFTDFL